MLIQGRLSNFEDQFGMKTPESWWTVLKINLGKSTRARGGRRWGNARFWLSIFLKDAWETPESGVSPTSFKNWKRQILAFTFFYFFLKSGNARIWRAPNSGVSLLHINARIWRPPDSGVSFCSAPSQKAVVHEAATYLYNMMKVGV